MRKSALYTTLFILFCALILVMGLRGNLGNPTAEELNQPEWKEDGPLELSPDRGRYALLYSIAEDKSVHFSLPIARFTTPDLAISSAGQYVSLFAPGLSFVAAPGYLIGKYFGASQVGAFAVISLFALINVFLLRLIAIRVGAHPIAATVAALAFLFGTPAFAYGVSMYQHHVSTFLVLASIYCMLRWRGWVSLMFVWFFCGASIIIDNPNIVMMFPIGLWALTRIAWLEKNDRKWTVSIRPLYMFTVLAGVLPILLLFWFNYASHGDPFKLSGTLKSVEVIDEFGRPAESDARELINLRRIEEISARKSAVGFFKTRSMLRGFYIYLFSPDRGTIWFAPIALFGIIGLYYLWQKNSVLASALIGVMGANFLLYSMWGDPYGGWAFGSRYLIPPYAVLCFAIAFLLTAWRKFWPGLLVFLAVFWFSVWVNSLGAITSSANPPQVQVLELEKLTGVEEKYTYERNADRLKRGLVKSLFYKEVASKHVEAETYLQIIVGMIGVLGTALISLLFVKSYYYERKQ